MNPKNESHLLHPTEARGTTGASWPSVLDPDIPTFENNEAFFLPPSHSPQTSELSFSPTPSRLYFRLVTQSY